MSHLRVNIQMSKQPYQNQLAKPLTINNFKQQLEILKKPHIDKIHYTAKQFHEKVENFENEMQAQANSDRDQSSSEQQNINTEGETSERIRSQIGQIKQKKLNSNKILTQESCAVKSNYSKIHRQWNPSPQSKFINYQDLTKKYQQTFQKKVNFSRPSKYKLHDYRQEELEMLRNIYKQISSEPTRGVKFEEIQQFFQQYDLFYSFYNIPKLMLKEYMKQTARTYSNMLTQDQFIRMLLQDRPIVINGKAKNRESLSINKCVLSDQTWKDLKAIFDTLDTFGNQQIKIMGFFHRIKTNPSHYHLLQYNAIYFPQVDRCYSLRKVMFNYEYKYKHTGKTTWNEILNFILNFRHKQNPAIDIIFAEQIKTANIQRDTNYFLLDQQIIDLIKDIFRRCPKYSEHFVKTKFLFEQLLDSSLLKSHLNATVRKDKSNKDRLIQLCQAIRIMAQSSLQFLDMDEMLEYLSIKGISKLEAASYENLFEINSSSEQQDLNQYRQKRKLRKIKSFESLKEVKVKKDASEKFRKIVYLSTKPVEFKLHSKQKQSIRERKLKEMLVEKQRQEMAELQKQFKANPIPSSINPEKYKAYVKMMNKKKQKIMEDLRKKHQIGKRTVEYLKSNTKLFQNKQSENNLQRDKVWVRSQKKFEAKPVPWFVKQDLLPIIEEEKQNRRKQILARKVVLYEEKYWANLKTFDERIAQEHSLSQIIHQQQEKYSRMIRANPVPNFEQLHRKFENQLKAKKQQFSPTIPRQFNLTSPKNKDAQDLFSNRLSTIQSAQKIKRRYSASPIQKSLMLSPPPIPTTKKFQAMIEKKQFQMQQKMIQERQKQLAAQQKKFKHKNFAKFMMNSFKQMECSQDQLKKQTKAKLQNFRKYQKFLSNQNKKELTQIYARVLQKPFLFEQVGGSNAEAVYECKAPRIPKKKQKKIKCNQKKIQQAIPEFPSYLEQNKNIQQEIEDSEDSQNVENEQHQYDQRYFDVGGMNQSF